MKAEIDSTRRRWCWRGCREAGGAGTGGPEGMPIGRGRSGGGVRLRSVSGIRGEGGGVFPRGAGASRALILALEAARCGRSAKACILPEMGCCVLGLVPIKNIKSTTWHGQLIGLKSLPL